MDHRPTMDPFAKGTHMSTRNESQNERPRSLRIALAHNLRQEESEDQAERMSEDYLELLRGALASLGHEVVPVEVTGTPEEIVDRLIDARPELVFNVAEGTAIPRREAYYPAIYEVLGLAYTGGGPALLRVGLDKRLMAKVFAVNNVRVPAGVLIMNEDDPLPEHLGYPLFIKPNYEGSSKGISAESLVESADEAREVIRKLLAEYPHGVDVEEFIPGRELTVPMLEEYPGHVLEIVEYSIEGDSHNIFDYERKSSQYKEEFLETHCPPELDPSVRQEVLALADRAFRIVKAPDFARADIRLHENGTPYLIEVNGLPGLRRESPMTTAAEAKEIDYNDLIDHIVRSARKRYQL